MNSLLKNTFFICTALMALHANAMNHGALQSMAAAHSGYQPATIYRPSMPLDTEKTINWQWQKKCDALDKTNLHATALEAEQLIDEIDALCKVENEGYLSNPTTWLNEKLPSHSFYDTSKYIFEPYVQKVEVTPGTEIAFHGDLHGDVHSLNAYIAWLAKKGYMNQEDPFKIKKPNFNLIFLGDYTDRGNYGAEVLFTIARLKRTNPNNVFLVRGNHEDIDINAQYGFTAELKRKFGESNTLHDKIKRMYNYLPVALYLACNNGTTKDVILCCHGGIDVGFDHCKELLDSQESIKCVLLGTLNRATNCQHLPRELAYIKNLNSIKDFTPTSPTTPHMISYLWDDVDVDNMVTISKQGRGLECDEAFIDFVRAQQSSKTCTIRGIFRGHQHGDHKMMAYILNLNKKSNEANVGSSKLWNDEKLKTPGILWDGIVVTFCVAPNTDYGNINKFNFDAFGILKTAAKYEEDWRLPMHCIVTKR